MSIGTETLPPSPTAETVLIVYYGSDDYGASGFEGFSSLEKINQIVNDLFDRLYSKAKSVIITLTHDPKKETLLTGHFPLPYSGPEIDLDKYKRVSLNFLKEPIENETAEEKKKREDYLLINVDSRNLKQFAITAKSTRAPKRSRDTVKEGFSKAQTAAGAGSARSQGKGKEKMPDLE